MVHVLRSTIAVLALTLLMLIAGPGGSASAGIVGLERVGNASISTSSKKSITVSCPAGKKVVGAAGDVTPGDGHVLIDDIRPKTDLSGVVVSAVEDETGTAANWYVHALATCANPPPGLQRVAVTSALNSAKKSVPARCPSGKRVLGTGGEINSPNGQVLLDDVRPSADLTTVTVNALEDQTGNSGNWSLTAYAICANPVEGLERVSAASAADSSQSRVVDVRCSSGKQITGVGGDITSRNGQVVLDAVFAHVDLGGAGFAAWEDDTGYPGDWSLTAYALCANVDFCAPLNDVSRRLMTSATLRLLGGIPPGLSCTLRQVVPEPDPALPAAAPQHQVNAAGLFGPGSTAIPNSPAGWTRLRAAVHLGGVALGCHTSICGSPVAPLGKICFALPPAAAAGFNTVRIAYYDISLVRWVTFPTTPAPANGQICLSRSFYAIPAVFTVFGANLPG